MHKWILGFFVLCAVIPLVVVILMAIYEIIMKTIESISKGDWVFVLFALFIFGLSGSVLTLIFFEKQLFDRPTVIEMEKLPQ